jgi:hypothetical protein
MAETFMILMSWKSLVLAIMLLAGAKNPNLVNISEVL